ncbi:MAG: DUF4292 domain-containing protein [Desulfobulbaceae bacterium]|nr:DUF4292 domain-containing protein [Desulfobulbaceae bacterium]HIJ78230.1 hypothetical protein [Deltaproteobacteria bacterium]
MKTCSLLTFFLLWVTGCATLPATVSLEAAVREQAKVDFLQVVASQQECNCCLDVQVRATVKSVLHKGSLQGFLQAMSPAYLKFVGLNPLGQPLVILSVDGEKFRYVVVPEAKGYEGVVTAQKFKDYAPKGFEPEHAFFWLAGRLAPEELEIFAVAEDGEGRGLWFELAYDRETVRRHLLFDPQEKLILRHIVVDEDQHTLMDVRYLGYQHKSAGEKSECRLPALIEVHASTKNGSVMELAFSELLVDAHFTERDFVVRLPAGFQREVIE